MVDKGHYHIFRGRETAPVADPLARRQKRRYGFEPFKTFRINCS
jgi:hypothetical protein